MGSSAARDMLSMVIRDAKGYQEPKVSPQDRADMEKELVQLIHTDELDAMGVSLFDSSAPGVQELSAEEIADKAKRPATLIMLITDGEKFGETVQRLKPAPEQKKQVDDTVSTLLGQSVELIRAVREDTTEPDDDGAQEALVYVANKQLEMFTDLMPTLVTQGFGELPASERLTEYIARDAAGTLGDYMGAESLGLLEEYFGPADWQTDSAPDVLSERWSKAFGYLLELRDRDNPSPYFTELFTKLHGDFNTARKWVDGDTDDESRVDCPDIFIEPLKTVMTELAGMWEEQFTLENGFHGSEADEHKHQ
jgi:hypothetical protein